MQRFTAVGEPEKAMKRRKALLSEEELFSWRQVCKEGKRASETREQSLHRQEQNRTHIIPYSGKFSLVQIFAEKRPDCSEEIFAVFIFADAGRSGHTSTS